MPQRIPHTTTNTGLHEFVAERILPKYARPGIRTADLGSGPGAMAATLHSFGCDVLAVDRNAEGFEADLPHAELDFDQNDFASELGLASFNLVTAIEVIEHVESPIGFLRNIGRMLAPQGVAVITTPNVDSLPARAKILLTGRIRTMDKFSEPTHISPIFWDLLRRLLLPRAACACASISSFLQAASNSRANPSLGRYASSPQSSQLIPFLEIITFWCWKPTGDLKNWESVRWKELKFFFGGYFLISGHRLQGENSWQAF